MNNRQFYLEEAKKILGDGFVSDLLESSLDIPLHTKSEWQVKGFKVKPDAKGHPIKQWVKINKNRYITIYFMYYTDKEIEDNEC